MPIYCAMTDLSPIVFCHGLFGWGEGMFGGYPYFVGVHRLLKKKGASLPPALFPSTGPISSLHDQACELFYQLKGGRVNYGKAHSQKYSHAQYGRTYDIPLYSIWDSANPLDFVGHSMGAPVIRMLQHLLAENFFSVEDECDYGCSASWVRSLTSVAGVHNGSTLTWVLGFDEDTSEVPSNAWAIQLITRAFSKYAALQARKRESADFYDLHLEQWGIANDRDLGFSIERVLSDPRFMLSGDWAFHDLTPNAMEAFNRRTRDYPDTRYYSFSIRSTISLPIGISLPVPYATHFFLIPFSFAMGKYKCASKKWKAVFSRSWRANDGMCNTWSQNCPKLGREDTYGRFPRPVRYRLTSRKIPPKGVWLWVSSLRFVDHAEVAMLPHLLRLSFSTRFYRRIFYLVTKTRE